MTYGADAKVISDVCHGKHFESHQEMISFIEQVLEQQQNRSHVLLVKGANSAGMSKIAAALGELLMIIWLAELLQPYFRFFVCSNTYHFEQL